MWCIHTWGNVIEFENLDSLLVKYCMSYQGRCKNITEPLQNHLCMSINNHRRYVSISEQNHNIVVIADPVWFLLLSNGTTVCVFCIGKDPTKTAIICKLTFGFKYGAGSRILFWFWSSEDSCVTDLYLRPFSRILPCLMFGSFDNGWMVYQRYHKGQPINTLTVH